MSFPSCAITNFPLMIGRIHFYLCASLSIAMFTGFFDNPKPAKPIPDFLNPADYYPVLPVSSDYRKLRAVLREHLLFTDNPAENLPICLEIVLGAPSTDDREHSHRNTFSDLLWHFSEEITFKYDWFRELYQKIIAIEDLDALDRILFVHRNDKAFLLACLENDNSHNPNVKQVIEKRLKLLFQGSAMSMDERYPNHPVISIEDGTDFNDIDVFQIIDGQSSSRPGPFVSLLGLSGTVFTAAFPDVFSGPKLGYFHSFNGRYGLLVMTSSLPKLPEITRMFSDISDASEVLAKIQRLDAKAKGMVLWYDRLDNRAILSRIASSYDLKSPAIAIYRQPEDGFYAQTQESSDLMQSTLTASKNTPSAEFKLAEGDLILMLPSQATSSMDRATLDSLAYNFVQLAEIDGNQRVQMMREGLSEMQKFIPLTPLIAAYLEY